MEIKTDEDVKASNLPPFMNEEATRENLRSYRHWLLYDNERGYIGPVRDTYKISPLHARRFTFDEADSFVKTSPLLRVPAPEVVYALQGTWVVLKKFERLVNGGEPWSPR